jgi:hypothetical protein
VLKTLTVALVLAAAPMAAQNREAIATAERLSAAAPKGPTPRTSSCKPDLSGLWTPDATFIYNIESALKKGEKLPLQPWAEKLAAQRMSKDDPEANCLPTGVPRQAPYPWRIVQTPTHIFFLFDGNIHSHRQVFIDGRKHPADLDPTWYGDSIGSWDGDTMVVDTIGFNDKFWFGFAGHPHTEQLHVVERYRRPDLSHLQFETTITDPGAYTRPFTLYGHSALLANTELFEYICNENNQDVPHITGKDDTR